MKRVCCIFGGALLILVAACDQSLPEGSPDDTARFIEGLVRFEERTYPTDASPTADSAEVRLLSAEAFAELVYRDCVEQAGRPQDGNPPITRDVLGACAAYEYSSFAPEMPSTCGEAVCVTVASHCVAERLYALTTEVEDYDSVRFENRNKQHIEITVPPQSPLANAALTEVATRWVGISLRTAGENLRSGVGLSHDSWGQCDVGTANAGDLFFSANEIPSVFSASPQPYSETLLSTLFESAQLQTTLAEALERRFSATADAERSLNSSPSAAARYAWIEGRGARSRGAKVLIGGDRDEEFDESGDPLGRDGLHRVPNGYGSRGVLSTGAQRALEDIRTSGVDPALLTGSASTIANEVRLAIQALNGIGDAELSEEAFLAGRGLSEEDFARAALWVNDAIDHFALDTNVRVDGDPDRFAATSTHDVVPPDVFLLNGARLGEDGVARDVVAYSLVRVRTGEEALASVADSLDYAADVVSGLPEKFTNVPSANRDAFEAVYREGAGQTLALRHGRFEACYFAGFQGQPDNVFRYFGPEEHVVLAATVSDLRCALRGNVHGAACTPTLFQPLESPVASAGVHRVRTWNAGGDKPFGYLLEEIRETVDGQEQVVGYRALSAARAPDGFFTCDIVPIVPVANAAAASLVRPSLDSADRADMNCVGLPTNQRLPLEDELSDDGDAFESSWRHYLGLAASASEQADRLADAVITNGIEIERRVELASAELEGVCGGAIDIDAFTLTQAPDASSLCVSQPDGTTVKTAEFGYVCQNGSALPDPLETVRARAEAGDTNALQLLECMGDSETIPWSSLGSRPLCLWQDDSGAACVGAAETSRQCPVFKDAFSTCDAQLAGAISAIELEGLAPLGSLSSVTVSTNLGVFANVIASGDLDAGTGEDPDGGPAPCDALRTLRSGATRADREAAMNEVLGDPWFDQTGISAEAARISWQALPYDYGVLLRDEEPWTWLGNPERGVYLDGQWPCGGPIDASLVDGGGALAGSCAGTSGDANAGPLGCAFTDHCTANGATGEAALLDRIRMNQRVARAAVTLRLITATGMRGMRLPTVIDAPDQQDTDRFFFPDGGGELDFAFASGVTYLDATGGASLGASPYPGFRGPKVRAQDIDGINAEVRLSGDGYCADFADPFSLGAQPCADGNGMSSIIGGCALNNVGYTWTRLPRAVQFGETACEPGELRDNQGSECFRIYSPCFGDRLVTDSRARRAPFLAQSFSSEDEQAPTGAEQLALTLLWPAIGPSAPVEYGRSRPHVIRETLEHFVASGGTPAAAAEVVPFFEEREFGGAYWRQNNNVRVLEDVTYGDIMDGLELACAVTESDFNDDTAPGVGGVSAGPCSPTRIAGLEAAGEKDIEQLQEFLRCSANTVEANAERMVVRNLPSEVVDTVRAEYGSATIPVLEGQRGVLIGETAADIIALRSYRIQLASVLRNFGDQVGLLRNELQSLGIQRQQLKLNLLIEVSRQITACVAASSPSISFAGGGSVNPGAAAATCANTAVQIGIAVLQLENSLRQLGLDISDAFIRFNSAYNAQADTLGELEVGLISAGHRLSGRSAQFANLRNEGRRSLGQAMLFSGDAAGRQLRVNTLLRRRFTTTQARYERAHEHALRVAYLAKLALEQRLGVRLEELTDDLTLVEAPASWESALCTMSGVDFARLRANEPPGDDTPTDDLESYADQFVGDYVDRLARVAESYRLDFPFHEGSDTAVISMRDVLTATRDTCDPGITVPNQLASSADLSGAPWSTSESCEQLQMGVDEFGEPFFTTHNCVQVSLADGTDGALGSAGNPHLGYARPFRVRFGPLAGGASNSSARVWTRHGQTLPGVEPGRYVLSWYARPVAGSPIDPSDAVEVQVGSSAVNLTVASEELDGTVDAMGQCSGLLNDGWCRYYALVQVPTRGDVTIGLAPNANDTGTVLGDVISGAQAIDIGGLQFEDVSDLIRYGYDAAAVRPTAFIATDDDALSRLPICEDTDGDVFRAGWRYDCERLCATGFRTDCPNESAEQRCYWERSFQITSEEFLGRGSRLESTGFAVGNYNYRADRVALNFVGTNVRNCEDSAFPSSCFGSGFVNYSIEHLGPYPVINHQGERYNAPLFTGLIENARGLSVERYLTNPVSSADRALVEPYSRSEFRGRPLTGQYVVRVWDDGAVDFDAIEDVQLLVDYRYWTRFR